MMDKRYRHLSEQDRIFLRIMLEKRYAKGKIAEILGVHRSTIYREIRRNSCTHYYSNKKFYWSCSAQEKYLKRRKRNTKFEKNNELKEYVHSKLKSGWSPWQIEGRLKLENADQCIISHETIYRYIYSNYGIRNIFYQKLIRKHVWRVIRKHVWRVKRNSRKPRVPKDMLINNRPQRINKREEFGHWEGDLMMFKQGIRGNLITLRERQTRFIIAIKNNDKTASGTAVTLISTVKKFKKHLKSITFDQGSEFNKYQWIKDCFGTEIYFCKPASPYQKHIAQLIDEINNPSIKMNDR